MLFTRLVLLVGFHLVLGPNVHAQRRPPEPRNYQNFDQAEQNLKNNMCPYLVQGDKRMPVVCWLCHFPTGLHSKHRYEYQCCPGYERSELVGGGCVKMEITWKPIIPYLKDRGNVNTAQSLSDNTAIPDLAANPSEKVYTVFVPQQDQDITKAELDYLGRDNSARMMVVLGRHYASDFVNGKELKNENAHGLKITTYSSGLTFVECRLLLSVDHETINGIVHYIDGTIPAVNRYPTVLSRLSSEPEASDFVKALPQDMRALLDSKDSSKWFTVFAPTNQAWNEAVQRMQPGESTSILARHHVLDRMLCSGAVIQESGDIGPTKADSYLKMTKQPDGKIGLIDSCNNIITFAKKDLMSGNGVVHLIDKAMLPLKAMDLKEAINCLGRSPESSVSQAVGDMNECNLAQKSTANVILLPTNTAFKSLNSNQANSEESSRFRSDKNYKCDVYAYHMLKSLNKKISPRGFAQQQRLQTDYTAPNGAKTFATVNYIRKRDGSKLNFNGASVENLKPIEYRDGIIYPVQSLNFPPEKTITQIIANEPNTTEIVQKIKTTGMQSEFSQLNDKVLFLAPIDMGWKTRDLENAYSNDQTRKLLQLHTIPHAMFGGSSGFVGHSTVQTVDTLLSDRGGDKVKLVIKSNPDGNTFIGHPELPENLWAMVLKWNKVGTDGVVWIIDWPIKCPHFTC